MKENSVKQEIKKSIKTGVRVSSWPFRSVVIPRFGKNIPQGTLRRDIYEFGKKQGWWK